MVATAEVGVDPVVLPAPWLGAPVVSPPAPLCVLPVELVVGTTTGPGISVVSLTFRTCPSTREKMDLPLAAIKPPNIAPVV